MSPAARAAIASRCDAIFGVDLRALGALRVALAALVLADLGLRARDLRAFYTDEGVLPRAAAMALAPPGALSILFLQGGVGLAAACFLVHVLAALAMLAGVRTRLATIVVWALTVSLHERNPLVEQGGDDLLRVLLFWAMFLPLGARFGVEARRDRAPAPARAGGVAAAALLLQVAAMYLSSALHKGGPEWRDGSAVWVALSHNHFGRPWAQRALLPHPELLRGVCRGVLAVEIGAPALLFAPVLTRPLRLAALAALVGLQLGLGATLHVAHFPWVSTVALLPFVPAGAWDALERRLHVRRRGPEGVGARVGMRVGSGVVAGAMLAYVLAWNVANLPEPVEAPLGRASALGVALGLDQQWTMFAPDPARDSGWFVLPGELADGTTVDLFPALGRFDVERPVTEDKPASVYDAFPGTRWLDYLMELTDKDSDALWAPLATWTCAGWNAVHGEARRLRSVTLTFVLEAVEAPGVPRGRAPHTYGRYACE